MATKLHGIAIVTTGLVAAFLLTVFLGSCGQRDPTQAPVGNIYVTANISGAAIFLDGVDMLQVTPDTLLGVPIGSHTVSVHLEGYASSPQWQEVSVTIGQLIQVDFILSRRRIALLEHFTWVYCQPCPAMNDLINGLLMELGPQQVVGIEYHPFEPDPFYEAAPIENIARKNYYNVDSVPALFLDGQEKSGTIDSLALLAAVESRLAETPVVGVVVTDTVVGQSWSGRAEIIGYADVVASDVRGFFVVLEREIHYSQPPGSNGEKDFQYVMRTMIPDAAGDILHISAGDTLARFGQFDLHPESNPAQIYSVYFVQNQLSKEVLQAGTSLGE